VADHRRAGLPPAGSARSHGSRTCRHTMPNVASLAWSAPCCDAGPRRSRTIRSAAGRTAIDGVLVGEDAHDIGAPADLEVEAVGTKNRVRV
jgi:hypothetical protein